jgi:hypothetical protein
MALPQAAKAPTSKTKINVLILDLSTSSAFNLQIFPVDEIIASLGADRKRDHLDARFSVSKSSDGADSPTHASKHRLVARSRQIAFKITLLRR